MPDTTTKPRRLTLAEARARCAGLGYTLRRTGCGAEIVVYPKGTSANHRAAYFTDDLEDAVSTTLYTFVRILAFRAVAF